jgi:hypothetical protein
MVPRTDTNNIESSDDGRIYKKIESRDDGTNDKKNGNGNGNIENGNTENTETIVMDALLSGMSLLFK